jgi:N-acetylmuramoyl-L-alanine amidase/FG-GAP-like repeat
MRQSRRRYIALCQRLLALGVVVVALVPASGVVSLDVVGVAPTNPLVPRQPLTPQIETAPTQGRPADHADELLEYTEETTHESEVPTAPVDPIVREVSLTPKKASAETNDEPKTLTQQAPKREVVSAPQAVSGLGTVGVTWGSGEVVADDAITVQVRTEQDGVWSEWGDLSYHEEHGPDPDSPEGRKARPGTDGTVVGEVDQVQVRVEMNDGELPPDLKLAVVDPGEAAATEEETPAIDTAELEAPPSDADATYAEPPVEETPVEEPLVEQGGTEETTTGDATTGDTLALQSTTVTPKPMIYSRAQWGADESMRDASSLSYFEVHGGFVHHTVNANDYKRKDVPAIIRSIYAYHVRSRGWSDIGYNFLVDRFGRIWEGRYGGVDRPVVGAHTLNYNSYSFAMSAIGNFELVQPSPAMLQAYGALMAWKLSLHGVSAGSTIQRIGSKTFQAINGHRDAASTACPGKYLYAKIPEIRRLAAAAQADWSGRTLQPNLVGTPAPDLVARRISDGQAIILPIETGAAGATLGKPVATGLSLTRSNLVLSVGDWDRDGFNDIATRSMSGALRVRRGDGTGHFVGAPIWLGRGYNGVAMLAAVGDMTGDGYPDLMGQPSGYGMRIYPGAGTAGVGTSYAAYSRVTGSQLVGVGRWDGDGAPDVMIRNGNVLTTWAGNGPGGLSGPLPGGLDVTDYDWIIGVGDVGLTAAPDLVVKKAGRGKLWLLPSGSTTRVVLARGMRIYDLVG